MTGAVSRQVGGFAVLNGPFSTCLRPVNRAKPRTWPDKNGQNPGRATKPQDESPGR